uniref:Inositolphosphotransferase Aur1/Ipt1 domain-containing protein n=1 Tax=Pyramimonas obovata TaxID=1411642 RepID=A0A7S0N6G4_9CHLO|mmetsp:Transcript_21892/g.48072  ORF Transcript_21892/g.48072 Transcript_21892/m.48072 type:complete len:459 (+) Transcript_21892:33-1409(+)|eukprot:CAMPEP_0118949980 /NCGR_PEP_ID=MMETSP1169-20130426/50590_1 /TAXON_ID=36882 /ORGANISM="Pyramimonas obovata, Strain CCMP722" /LENGTH=458 /DNA_ID=CAMNT_0006896721 /DNA_START=29 /DNA_END=1405 /DNA_ORIENTATION=+
MPLLVPAPKRISHSPPEPDKPSGLNTADPNCSPPSYQPNDGSAVTASGENDIFNERGPEEGLDEFAETASQLRPPVTAEEYKFRSFVHGLHPALRSAWDTFRLRSDQIIPCHSQYLDVELQSEHPYWAVTDIALLVASFAFLPLYFAHFDFNFQTIFAFALNRLAIPILIIVLRTNKSLRGDRRALFALDMTAWYTCLGGMYGEVGTVILATGWDFFDDTVQRYEEAMWGTQPAQKFQEVVPNKLVGEYFHWCYFIFYAIMFLPLPVTYWGYSRDKYLSVATAQTLTIIICSIIWLYYPCEGPYWTLGGKEASEVGYFMPYIVHYLVEGGSSRGTAMPSSHCGVSAACWLAVVWETKDYQLPFLLVTPGLWLATVYGTFHYVFDSMIGIIIGVFSVFIGRFMTRYFTDHYTTKAGINAASEAGNQSPEVSGRGGSFTVEKTPLNQTRHARSESIGSQL